MSRALRVFAVVVAASWGAGALAAQAPRLRAGASVVNVRAESDVNGGRVRVGGTVLAGLVTRRFGRFEVDGRYLQGVLHPQDGSSARRDLVQGELMLGYGATPWLALQTGARARTYITSAITERWLVWSLGVRAETPIVGPAVSGHVALWRALASGANVGSDEGGASRGGDAGITLLLPGRPWWVRLAYAIDRSVVDGAGRRETVEELTLTVGVRPR
jgi:hypothetical protein